MLRQNLYVFYQDLMWQVNMKCRIKKNKYIKWKSSVTCICTLLFIRYQVLLQLQLKALCGGSLPALHIDESEFLPILLWIKYSSSSVRWDGEQLWRAVFKHCHRFIKSIFSLDFDLAVLTHEHALTGTLHCWIFCSFRRGNLLPGISSFSASHSLLSALPCI